MPVVLRHGSYRFFFYSNEGDPLEPAYIHVASSEGKAKIWLRPEITIAYARGLDPREMRLVVALVDMHRGRFERAWNAHFG